MTTEILDAPTSAVAEYQPFYAQLAELEKNNSLIVFDYESSKGNKEARSHVHSLRLTKGALERARKTAKDESVRIGRAVDAEAKEIEARIEAMIKVHQEHLDEIEKRETDRVHALRTRLQDVTCHGIDASNSAELKTAIATLEPIAIDDTWQESIADAAKAKDARLAELRAMLVTAEKHEAEQVELVRLRAEAEARAQQERDAQIAKQAAEKARAAAEDQAKQEREAAARRELELKLQAEQAERRRVESEQKAEQDRKDALAKAEAEKQRAIEAKQARVAAAAQAEANAKAQREADTAHMAGINRAALAALVAGGIEETVGKAVLKLIANGKVPAVQIVY
jgi:colicin import membrane protein